MCKYSQSRVKKSLYTHIWLKLPDKIPAVHEGSCESTVRYTKEQSFVTNGQVIMWACYYNPSFKGHREERYFTCWQNFWCKEGVFTFIYDPLRRFDIAGEKLNLRGLSHQLLQQQKGITALRLWINLTHWFPSSPLYFLLNDLLSRQWPDNSQLRWK